MDNTRGSHRSKERIHVGDGSFYLGTYNDSEANRSMVVSRIVFPRLDATERRFVRSKSREECGRLGRYFFGPTPLRGQESNWLFTEAGRAWTPWFRFYGPEKALFDKTWTMPDMTCSESVQRSDRT
jgi:hypothetical protein